MHDEITLIPTDERYVGGNLKRKPKYDEARAVFARALSVGEREFFDASQAGFELDAKFQLWQWDYQDERRLSYQGREYEVVRQYRNDKNRMVELSCARVEGRTDGDV
jgi:SPP1 family predicted phage head-tail adaptor